MCITQDNLPQSHVEQTKRLCAAGAKWIQLRMKNAPRELWLTTAADVVAICRDHGAICIINDDVEVALASGADGVHLGRTDESWRGARERLGPRRILGGTVNNTKDAHDAALADCLDYVGVGPWRFTTNKQNLAPVLGAEGVRALVRQLDGLPAWAIGGIEADDLPAVRATGATGAAVSSVLYRGGNVEENYRSLVAAWTPKQLR
jgi:thiamine-phosphate pyrophosphorylase